MDNEHWLTVEQVADHLQVNTETVRRWIRKRELPHLAMGKSYRILPADLDSFVVQRYRLSRYGEGRLPGEHWTEE